MRKVITEEERTPLNEAGEMFNETGCVPGIDGEQVPAERMVLDAKEYILEANDKTSLLTFLASTLTDDGKLRFTSNEVTHRQSPQGRTRCERLQCEPARTSIRAGQSDRLPLGGLGVRPTGVGAEVARSSPRWESRKLSQSLTVLSEYNFGAVLPAAPVSPEKTKIKSCALKAGGCFWEGQLWGADIQPNSQVSRQQGSRPGGMRWVFSPRRRMAAP
jgi:hypothetical protein